MRIILFVNSVFNEDIFISSGNRKLSTTLHNPESNIQQLLNMSDFLGPIYTHLKLFQFTYKL